MSLDLLRSFLGGLGAQIGLSGLAPNDDGYCLLQVENLPVSIQYQRDTGDVVLFARLCRIAAYATTEANEMMLAGNLFWGQTDGATLAIQQPGNEVYLLAKDKLQALDGLQFKAMLERFVHVGEVWRQRLELLTSDEDDEPAGPPPEDDDRIRLT
jgi:hypothetical protein